MQVILSSELVVILPTIDHSRVNLPQEPMNIRFFKSVGIYYYCGEARFSPSPAGLLSCDNCSSRMDTDGVRHEIRPIRTRHL